MAAGVTAAVVHDIGDFFLDGIDFIVGSRKTTRLPEVRLRIRPLTPADVTSVNGLPTLTVERTIIDLLNLGTDTSLIDDAMREALDTSRPALMRMFERRGIASRLVGKHHHISTWRTQTPRRR